MASDWRKGISFSERLGETSKMQLLHTKMPIRVVSRLMRLDTPKPPKRPPAKTPYPLYFVLVLVAGVDSDLLQKEYHELCAKTVQLLMSSAASKKPVQDHHAEEHIFPNLPSTGARIGKYTNAEHFKDGLFSEVFRAADPDTKTSHGTLKVVALKVTTPEMEKPPHDSRKEARMLSAAKGDCIIPLLETFQQACGHLVLVFPYMPHDLDILLHRRQLTPESGKTILQDLFRGLKHLHGLGIIHRDIKPSNILLSSASGPACIADFGTAWSASDSASEPPHEKITDVGTTCYRPPEILFGSSSYNEKLDMWAAGCVVAQVVCLQGKTLFDAGELGSELALIKSMFETLGTPDETTWPEASKLADWGKMNFRKCEGRKWEDILLGASETAIDLVKHLVVFESTWRLGAEDVSTPTCDHTDWADISRALRHPFFQ